MSEFFPYKWSRFRPQTEWSKAVVGLYDRITRNVHYWGREDLDARPKKDIFLKMSYARKLGRSLEYGKHIKQTDFIILTVTNVGLCASIRRS